MFLNLKKSRRETPISIFQKQPNLPKIPRNAKSNNPAEMSTRRKKLIAVLSATVVIVALFLWYFSAPRTYDLSLGDRYRYRLTYRHAAKTVILLPRSEALRNDGEMNCELQWDLVPFRFVEGVYSIALFLSPRGDCRFLFNGKDLFDDASFRERLFAGRYAVLRMVPTSSATDPRWCSRRPPWEAPPSPSGACRSSG